jgi:hypothetical protein
MLKISLGVKKFPETVQLSMGDGYANSEVIKSDVTDDEADELYLSTYHLTDEAVVNSDEATTESLSTDASDTDDDNDSSSDEERKTKVDSVFDWNKEFQAILQMEDNMKKFQDLSRTYKDFVYAAKVKI